ncbi:lipid II:glycine glycyltransferase FemX [Pseudonocardia spirodelae]|uniref:GNAT family N-acetyltransferase n=1 Tax=Pseudonocardia spirodelae TaxID=3133431 RepID=A0ABU8T2V1_9PSEU
MTPAHVVARARPDGPLCPPGWDDTVRGTPDADVTQLSGWARLRALAGHRAEHLPGPAGADGPAGVMVLSRRIPLLGPAAYVSGGPVVAPAGADRAAQVAALADALAGYARRRAAMLVVQPPYGADDVSAALRERGFRPATTTVAPAASVRVDLTRDEAALRAGLSKRLRTWTNRWAERGVTVRTATGDDLAAVARLLAGTARRQGFRAVGEGYLRALCAELVAHGDAVIRIGEAGGVPAAVDVLTVCGGSATVRFVGSDLSGPAGALNVTAAVRWDSMLWARAAGLRWFDLGGVRPQTAAAIGSGPALCRDEVADVDRAKLRYGGELHRRPPAVELVPGRVVRTVYDGVRSSRRGRDALSRAAALVRAGVGGGSAGQ